MCRRQLTTFVVIAVALAPLLTANEVGDVSANTTHAQTISRSKSTSGGANYVTTTPSQLSTKINASNSVPTTNVSVSTASSSNQSQPSTTPPPGGGSGEGGSSSSSSSKKSKALIVGMVTGFGFVFGLVVGLCIVWKCCCRMMHGKQQANRRVAPMEELEETESTPEPAERSTRSRPGRSNDYATHDDDAAENDEAG